ncbi:MAG: hypothetical protein A3B23_01895 [Candidatus Colwellbacteria bacterium RIFCSPLOWO2_01_FULL_48_10]|uniref:Uncharacterized protein n=1 Tax=Candidatus Colwellbacteria bacterium RIFCSPLOWO2_01_FULL_48_10 TaxID=1797690 RepID=A0A1G1Z7K2_9BACT|nr:MAG: hypothetical protein A3B23_01895 [Candidatus Colwellbacteria bacterium RIFCSPLOWO2_01_FULL_48_10]
MEASTQFPFFLKEVTDMALTVTIRYANSDRCMNPETLKDFMSRIPMIVHQGLAGNKRDNQPSPDSIIVYAAPFGKQDLHSNYQIVVTIETDDLPELRRTKQERCTRIARELRRIHAGIKMLVIIRLSPTASVFSSDY